MQRPKRKDEATGRIKILKTPDGEAPRWVREAWVGLILACFPYIESPSGRRSGILSGEEIRDNRRGVIVPQDAAIATLLQHDREAAEWWMAHGSGEDKKYFFFLEDEIGIVNGVTEAPMRIFDDLETGHWEEMPLGAGGR